MEIATDITKSIISSITNNPEGTVEISKSIVITVIKIIKNPFEWKNKINEIVDEINKKRVETQ